MRASTYLQGTVQSSQFPKQFPPAPLKSVLFPDPTSWQYWYFPSLSLFSFSPECHVNEIYRADLRIAWLEVLGSSFADTDPSHKGAHFQCSKGWVNLLGSPSLRGQGCFPRCRAVFLQIVYKATDRLISWMILMATAICRPLITCQASG